MPDLETLKAAVENKSAHIAQIGLGYVGLPVACMFAKAGFRTTGVDVDTKRIAMLNRGENPIEGIEPGLTELIVEVVGMDGFNPTTEYNDIADADVVIVTVQTPVQDSDHRPRYAHMQSALAALGEVLKDGALIIIESTLAPGTIKDVIIPVLEEATSGKVGERFQIGHCPERVMPGRLLHNITKMDRVVGVYSPEIGEIVVALYSNIVKGKLDVTDVLTAELVKTTENAYRDMQIAFANEVALICEALGGDVWRVRELVNKSPGRNMLYPGAGVGGHCIPKDPWLLIANLNGNYNPSLIPAARELNRSMPGHIAELTKAALKDAGVKPDEAIVSVLGYAYLENSDDTRDTPSQAFIEILGGWCKELRIHDPFVKDYQTDLDTVLSGANVAVILVAHDLYRQQNWTDKLRLLQTPVLVDARHVLPDDFSVDKAHIRVIGKGGHGND